MVFVLAAVFACAVWYQYRQSHEEGSIEVVMCPDCKERFYAEVAGGGDIICALYDVGKESRQLLINANARVITDDESNSAYGTPYVHAGLMHDKFCVINGSTVITGSYNPTDGGELSRNNMLIIHSKILARNYAKEWRSMETKAPRPGIIHKLTLSGMPVENYFCPGDGCEDAVLRTLEKAQSEIVFMTFSFTSDPIGNLLIKKAQQGIHVEGICEDRQVDDFSECDRLDAHHWQAAHDLHHKVFIIDKRYVVTGSYNPTSSGDRRNRENIIIIDNATIAQQYLMEYEWVQAPD